jgi:putative ABC transport system permease protein
LLPLCIWTEKAISTKRQYHFIQHFSGSTGMKPNRIVFRSLIHYWRTNVAIIAGVATAVAVLSGALLVGQSVRSSLRSLLYERIGNTEAAITADRFFREELTDSIPDAATCPILYLKGIVTLEKTRIRAQSVNIYGIDERFWNFQGFPGYSLESRSALIGDALAKQLGATPGDSLLVRVEDSPGIPREWLYGHRDALGKTIRTTCKAILPDNRLGEFELRPSQGDAYSLFIPMERLQKDLGQTSKINTVLLKSKTGTMAIGPIRAALKKTLRPDDLGVKLKPISHGHGFSLESSRIVLDESIAAAAVQAAAEMGLELSPLYTYLANSIRANGRAVPYSAITAADIGRAALSGFHFDRPVADSHSLDSIWLTDWAARDLGSKPGDSVEVDYYIWLPEGRLATRTARFRQAGTVRISGDVDSSLSPEIPGVTSARSISSWDPPFPLDLGRIRREDEEYWKRYRATPKAFIRLQTGQDLWQTRFGKLTAIRCVIPGGVDPNSIQEGFLKAFSNRLDPEQAGFSVAAIRQQGLAASQGSTDFGEYFAYFSSFLIAAALLLSSLFFKLMIEQRVREIGMLRAAGFTTAKLWKIFFREGLVLSALGSFLGLGGSLVYGWLMMLGLRTWWMGAAGTRHLNLYVSWPALAAGAGAGILLSIATIAWVLRKLKRLSPRMALAGALEPVSAQNRRTHVFRIAGVIALFMALLLIAGARTGRVSQLEAFFGAGFLLLVSILSLLAAALRRAHPKPIRGAGYLACLRLGIRNASHRPARSLLCAALIASATFIIVSMETFRQDASSLSTHRQSGTGGFPLLAESSLPIISDLNSAEGRDALGISDNIPSLDKAKFVSFRERPGDDASCLNLYSPQEPAILGVPNSFVAAGRFVFQDSLAAAPEQRRNPWLLLESPATGGAIPAIADANTIQYILHLSPGSYLQVHNGNGNPVRLRIVASLKDSILQGKILISETNFLNLFPYQEGYRFFLLDAPSPLAQSLVRPLKENLADWGFQVVSSEERLASYHRVENTYLSTFQFLGTLGLLLGTVGLSTILLRNVLERRHELALLQAVGYRRSILSGIVLVENLFLIVWGLGSGTVCALISVMPAMMARGSSFPIGPIGLVMLAVLFFGLSSSILAMIAAFRSPLLAALRSE